MSTVWKMLIAVAVVLGLCLANFLLEAIAQGFGSSLLGLVCSGGFAWRGGFGAHSLHRRIGMSRLEEGFQVFAVTVTLGVVILWIYSMVSP